MRNRLLAILLLGASATTASADHRGYICQVSYHPGNGDGTGAIGYVRAVIYAEPGCATYVGDVVWCSTGATDPKLCARDAFHYAPEALLALYQTAVRALAEKIQVYAETEVGSSSKGRALYLHGS